MDAPEKIYLTPLECMAASCQPQKDNTVEYTRTDAFIEKVSDWLKDCATITYMNGEKHIDIEMYKATFEDFKNFIKGE